MKISCRILFFCAMAVAFGQPGAKMYPGAKLDQAATDEAKAASASEPGVEIAVYATADSFDKVYSYFTKHGHEFKPIGSRTRKLPNGQELRDAFFILDGAANLALSKLWVKLQRPYLGQYGLDRRGGQSAIRDVTAIILTKTK